MKRHLLVGALAFVVGCGNGTGGTGGGGTGGGAAGTTGGGAGTTGGGAGTTGGGAGTTGGGAGTTGGGAGTTGAGGQAGGGVGTAGTIGTGGAAGGAAGAAGGRGGAAGGAAGGRGGAAGGAAGAGAGGRGGTTGVAGTTGAAGAGGGTAANQSVLERNKNRSRDGHFIQPTLTKAAAATMAADTAFNTAATFSGNVWGSPLYLQDGPGGAGLFFTATVNNDVIARNEDGTSRWTRNIGAPATGSVGCFSTNGGIPTLGIISTPVIDAQSRTIFVAGAIGNAQGVTGQIVSAINVDDGIVRSGWPVNISTVGSFDATIHNQRSALSFVGGTLYVPYGGYIGDCGNYRGRIVAINPSSPSTIAQWATAGQGEGIWAPGGLASDGTGVFAITGNRTPSSATSMPHADSEEVVRVTATGTKADFFYPSNWVVMDRDDADFGSVNPLHITVPGATPANMVVAIAKDGHMYLLDAAQLRGTSSGTEAGGHKVDFMLANGAMSIVTVPASYRTAQGVYVVLSTTSGSTGCPAGGTGSGGRRMMAVRIAAGNPPVPTIAWCAEMSTASTGPIATTTDGQSDAIVWYMNNGSLRGVDGDTGATVYSSTNTCAGVQKWTSPIAVKGRIIAGGNGRLCAWGIPGALTQAPNQQLKSPRRTLTSAAYARR